MSRTIRKYNPYDVRRAQELAAEDWFHPRGNTRALMRGSDGVSTTKCGSARVDNDGNFALDTWDDKPNKNGGTVTRDRRRAYKRQIQREVDDYFA